MKTCNDCIHCEACISQVPRTFWDSETFYDGCKYFKDKSRFIELPCKVGDTLYEIHERFKGGKWIKTISERRVRGIEIVIHNILIARCATDISVFLSGLGKTVFVTREEAEKALKERER